jgi:hypothetical protein
VYSKSGKIEQDIRIFGETRIGVADNITMRDALRIFLIDV